MLIQVLARALALLILLVCTGWLAREPEWEPAAAFLGALVTFVTAEVKLPPKNTSHDSALLRSLLTELPSAGRVMRFLRDQDLGDSFPSMPLDELSGFVQRWNNAEHEFVNKKLERQRKRLLGTAEKFVIRLSQHSTRVGGDFLSVGVPDFDIQPEKLKLRQELNELATAVYDAQQDIVRLGRDLLRA